MIGLTGDRVTGVIIAPICIGCARLPMSVDHGCAKAHTDAVATRISHLLAASFPALRYEPTAKRVRASCAGDLVVDTRGAVLVWEPQRIVPIYAVPESALVVPLTTSGVAPQPVPASARMLTPDDAFALHTTAGTTLDLELPGRLLEAAAFRPADPDLAHLVLLDFAAFDWREEDAAIHTHPRDPFHRVDILASSSHVRVELEGMVLADSTRPLMLFETHLPPRYYLPRADVRFDALVATQTSSSCPYKGTANYWAPGSGGKNVAWSYAHPLPESAAIAAHVAFYNERTDIIVDGQRLPRPITPFG